MVAKVSATATAAWSSSRSRPFSLCPPLALAPPPPVLYFLCVKQRPRKAEDATKRNDKFEQCIRSFRTQPKRQKESYTG